MKRDYKIYLKDVIDAMESIEEFVRGLDLEEFREDDKTVSAVINFLHSVKILIF